VSTDLKLKIIKQKMIIDIFKRIFYKKCEMEEQTLDMMNEYNTILGEKMKLNLNKDIYDIKGYDKDGYNKDGFDVDGVHKSTYICTCGEKKNYYDYSGRDVNGYDRDGYDRDGFDIKGFDRIGYNKKGKNAKGYNREGFNKDNHRIGCKT